MVAKMLWWSISLFISFHWREVQVLKNSPGTSQNKLVLSRRQEARPLCHDFIYIWCEDDKWRCSGSESNLYLCCCFNKSQKLKCQERGNMTTLILGHCFCPLCSGCNGLLRFVECNFITGSCIYTVIVFDWFGSFLSFLFVLISSNWKLLWRSENFGKIDSVSNIWVQITDTGLHLGSRGI